MKYRDIRSETRSKMTDRTVPKFEPQTDPKAWAKRLKEKHERGGRLTLQEISAYREALGLDRG